MHVFLSDSWFAEVDRLRAEAGDLEIPEAIRDVVINIVVSGHPEGDKELHVVGGEFKQGLHGEAPTKMTVPFDVARGMWIQQDPAVAMQAFMSGQIQVEGDMAVVMQMQAAGEPSAAAKQLQAQVREITQV